MNTLQKYDITDPTIRATIKKERARRLVVVLIFVVYWLLMFEGALRKWVFPSMQKYIFFIKDPFVFMVYLIAIRHKLFPNKNKIFITGLAIASFFLLIFLWQTMTTDVNPIIFIYGWRMYFYYFPLAFIMGENLQGKDLYCLVRYALLLTIPMGVLCFFQYSTSPGSFWNSTPLGIAYTESGVSGGTTARLTGTFSFFHAMQLYIGSMIALILSVWSLSKNRRPLKGILFFMASISVIAIFGMDITRLPTILALIIISMYIFSIFIVTDYKMRVRTIRFFAVLVLVVMVISGGFFFKAADIREARFKGKEDYLKRRTGSMFMVKRTLIEKVPYFGVGLGFTSRGARDLARVFGGGTYPDVVAGENEWSRIIAEAGSVGGIIFILYRFVLLIYIFIGAMRAVRRSNNILPLLLFAFISPVLVVWYMTTIGQVNSFGWIYVGICMAASKLVDTWRTYDEIAK